MNTNFNTRQTQAASMSSKCIHAMFVIIGIIISVLYCGHLSANQITLTMITETRDANRKWQEEMIAAFEEQYPHIEIDLVDPTGIGLRNKMQMMLAEGIPLDIGYMDPWLIVEWAKEGWLEDLRPYIENHAGQYASWAPPFFELYTVGDGMYGLPQDIQLGAIFYDKDAYDSVGIAYPSADWTYDDLFDNGKSLTSYESDITVKRHGFRMPTGRNIMPTIWAFGGDLLDDWASPSRFIGNNSDVELGIQYLADLVTYGIAQDRATHNEMSLTTSFHAGRASMVMSNTVNIGSFISNADFRADAAPLPRGPGGHIPQINAIGWMLFRSSQHKEEAWKLLRFLTSEEALTRRVEIVGNISPSFSVTQNVWIEQFDELINPQLLLKGVENSRSSWSVDNNIWAIIGREVTAAYWGEKSVAQSLAEMERLINALINR